jgi:Zn-dependent metalloprotease
VLDRQGLEVTEALADMFAYDFDRDDATLGEDDGSASMNWADPGSIESPTEGAPYPASMRDYKCDATDPHFNATILSHAYWRFVRKVGHEKAGRVLQYISWFLEPAPRFIDVARGFVRRSRDLYPGSRGAASVVAAAAEAAFRDEVGVGRDVPAGDGC